MNNSFEVKRVAWQTHCDQLKKLRTSVFIEEQHVPTVLEWDGLDANAQHLLVLDAQAQPIGCARLIGHGSVGQIGRMAVLKPWRKKGVGSALLAEALAYFDARGITSVKLSAQVHAIPFYEKTGFCVCSAPYLDAGILHQDMQLDNKARMMP